MSMVLRLRQHNIGYTADGTLDWEPHVRQDQLLSQEAEIKPTHDLKWDGMCQYGIPALLLSAWDQTVTSFWSTAIPVCRRPLHTCRCKICQKRICSQGSARPRPCWGSLQRSHSPL